MEWLLRRETAPRDAILERDFQQWLAEAESHRRAYEAVRSTWAELGALPAGKEAAGTIVRLPVPKPRRTRWIAAAATLAAACVLVVAIPVLHRHVVTDYATGVAELREVSLPDGSVVHLDAGSAIAVDYAEADRRVTLLSGQAFFEVTRDGRRPFSVLAGDVAVVVTGTAFSVGKTATTIEVAVRSGTVDVLQDGKSMGDPLTIGDRVTVGRRDKAVHRDRIAAESVASWRKRKLVVVDTSFGDIVEALGRYLPGVILVDDGSLKRQAITGVFDLTQPVEALRTLARSQDASVTEVTPYLLIVSRR